MNDTGRNFSGQTPVVISQDFHASILMSNVTAVADAQAEIQERIDPNNHKYVDIVSTEIS